MWVEKTAFVRYSVLLLCGVLVVYSLLPSIQKMAALFGISFNYQSKFVFAISGGDFSFIIYLVLGWIFHEYRNLIMRLKMMHLVLAAIACLVFLSFCAYFSNSHGDTLNLDCRSSRLLHVHFPYSCLWGVYLQIDIFHEGQYRFYRLFQNILLECMYCIIL